MASEDDGCLAALCAVLLAVVITTICATSCGQRRMAEAIADGRATVEKHTFADGTTEYRVIWKEPK